MDMERLQESLIKLDWIEYLGKCHFERYGKNLSYLQFLYLKDHPLGKTQLEKLYDPPAVAEQQRIQAEIQKRNTSHILNPQDFFHEGKNIEIEKLLRYVDIPPHQHDFIECAYVVSGTCVHQINGWEYRQPSGSFVTFPYGYSHALFPGEDCLCLTVKIRNEAFRKLQFPGLTRFVYPLSFPCGDDPFVRSSIAAIWEQQQDDLPYCGQIEEQIFQTMMFYMEQRFHDETQYLVSGAAQDRRMLEILGFMMDNYQSITLQSVAAHFHYSTAYLSRLFHEQTGMTFSGVLKEFKLRQAAKFLLDTDGTLNDICGEVGYRDTTQFIRSFKMLYGETPAQYRKKMKLSEHS